MEVTLLVFIKYLVSTEMKVNCTVFSQPVLSCHIFTRSNAFMLLSWVSLSHRMKTHHKTEHTYVGVSFQLKLQLKILDLLLWIGIGIENLQTCNNYLSSYCKTIASNNVRMLPGFFVRINK